MVEVSQNLTLLLPNHGCFKLTLQMGMARIRELSVFCEELKEIKLMNHI